jgi:thiosulfate/3-mercaptopyruvate sulfurtransferase
MERRRSSFLVAGFLFSLSFLLPSPFDAKTPPFENAEHPRLIDTGELAGALSHPILRIVDMRTSFLDYLRGHIPNAVYLHFENLRIPRNGIPAQLPDRISLEKLLGSYLSVSNDMWVVVYSEKSGPNAPFLAWVLDALGHRRIGVLNGGWEKWIAEKLPTTQEYPGLVSKKFFGRIKQDSLADKKWVRNRLFTKGVLILDARPPEQYSGEEGEEIRRGHIPGARNVFWQTTLEGDEIRTWKKREDLERLFAESGAVREQEIVVYSRTARDASHLYFTLKFVLGYPNVRLYRGSWVEWSHDRSFPVKTGAEP